MLRGNRAQARLRAGVPVRALQDVEAALALDATSTRLLLRRAACNLALERGEEAEADYRAALALDPECEAARRALAGDFSGGGGEGGEGGAQAGRAGGGGGAARPGGSAALPAGAAGGELYGELGLPASASYGEVKAAFRRRARSFPRGVGGGRRVLLRGGVSVCRLALELHPDKFRGDEAGRTAAQARRRRRW